MGAPNAVFTLALLGYFPLTAWCFSRFGPRRGMLVALFGGWLFLPTFNNSDLLPLMKSKAILVGAAGLAMSVLFDQDRWSRFRPQLVDVPMLAYGVIPFASAISNGHGVYEGVSAMFEASLAWGAPYLLGRIYLRDRAAILELALAFVISALVYVPLALFEIRMSPQLHAKLYGYLTFDFGQSVRFGGYRPSVFMQHGLMLGLFLASATLIAWWLWRTGARRTLGGRPFSWVVAVLMATTLLCKSTGAIVLLAAGIAVLEGTRKLRNGVLVLVLMAIPPAYCAARVSGWTGEALVHLAEEAINADRADSLMFRIRMEDLLIDKALERPALGWGRFGGSRVVDPSGKDITVTDGLWIILLGITGYAGLISLGLGIALPVYYLLRRYPARFWGDPRLAPAAALGVVLLLTSIDNLLNAMTMPLFPATAGALAALAMAPARHPAPAQVPSPQGAVA